MRVKNLTATKFVFIWSILALFAFSAIGCAKKEEAAEEPIIVVANEDTGYTYNLEEVKRGDVVLAKTLSCEYVQAKEQEVSFSEGGKLIEKVHVREGDYVKTGDLLAEVSFGELEEEIAALEYQIKKNELQLGYLETYQDFALRDSYYAMVYRTACEEEDVEEWEERDEEILESYGNQREDYQDELEFDRAKLAELKKELENSRLYANMDGVVYSIQQKLEGTTSKRDEVIMTIIDGSEGMFEMEAEQYARYFHEDDIIQMEITYGSAAGEYELIPYQMDMWGEKQYFSIYDGPENEGIEVNTKGEIHMVLDEKENVIFLPNECIYKADDKSYVYVLDDQNMQTASWVEIGLVGDTYTEILSGLNEGDMVIKR